MDGLFFDNHELKTLMDASLVTKIDLIYSDHETLDKRHRDYFANTWILFLIISIRKLTLAHQLDLKKLASSL